MEAKSRITRTTEENCYNTLKERLAEQDKISFKAGGQESDKKWRQILVDSVALAKLVGIKEVVEWADETCPHDLGEGTLNFKRNCDLCWQAKLKSWNIGA